MRRPEQVAIDAIIIPQDRQPPDPATVAGLKSSITEVGLLNPIVIQRHTVMGRCFLVAGRNRLQAAEELGWDAIDAIELPPLNEANAEAIGKLAEVAENLHRREIDALERDELVLRWAELVKERKVQSAQVAQIEKTEKPTKRADGRGHRKPGGISQTARDLGMSRDDVRRAIKVGNLSSEAKQAAREHGLADNRAALLEAAKAKTPETQVAAIQQRAAAAEKPKPPRPKVKPSAEPVGLRELELAWDRASDEARELHRKKICGGCT